MTADTFTLLQKILFLSWAFRLFEDSVQVWRHLMWKWQQIHLHCHKRFYFCPERSVCLKTAFRFDVTWCGSDSRYIYTVTKDSISVLSVPSVWRQRSGLTSHDVEVTADTFTRYKRFYFCPERSVCLKTAFRFDVTWCGSDSRYIYTVTKDSISVLSVPSVWRQRSGLTSPDVEVTADTFTLLQKILFLSWAFRLFEDSVQVWRHLMWKWQQIHLHCHKRFYFCPERSVCLKTAFRFDVTWCGSDSRYIYTVTKDSISVLSVPSVWRQRSGLTSPDVEVTADTFTLLQKILFLSWAFRLFEDSVQVWRHLMWKWQQIHLHCHKRFYFCPECSVCLKTAFRFDVTWCGSDSRYIYTVTKDSISVLSVPSVWRQRSGLTSPDVEVTADTFILLQKILFLSWAFRLFEDSVQVWRHLMWKWQQIHLHCYKRFYFCPERSVCLKTAFRFDVTWCGSDSRYI